MDAHTIVIGVVIIVLLYLLYGTYGTGEWEVGGREGRGEKQRTLLMSKKPNAKESVLARS